MPSLVDHLFVLLLVAVQPIYGTVSYRRYLRLIEAGEPADRIALYRQTMVIEWLALAALALFWSFAGRTADGLGFSAPAGAGFWAGCVVVLVASALLARSWRKITALPRQERDRQLEKLGELVHFLPRPGRELRNFYAISITAGVVEEVLYRGFLLWYLAQFMPLWAAVLLSSLIFGLGHSYQGANGVLRTGLAGLAFAGLYVMTGSIWLPILGHALLDVLQGGMIAQLFREPSGSDPAEEVPQND